MSEFTTTALATWEVEGWLVDGADDGADRADGAAGDDRAIGGVWADRAVVEVVTKLAGDCTGVIVVDVTDNQTGWAFPESSSLALDPAD